MNPNSASASFRRLPYDHCALSLQLFENPLCDTEGNVFDLLAIVPYLKKYKTNPVTGKVSFAYGYCMFASYHKLELERNVYENLFF